MVGAHTSGKVHDSPTGVVWVDDIRSIVQATRTAHEISAIHAHKGFSTLDRARPFGEADGVAVGLTDGTGVAAASLSTFQTSEANLADVVVAQPAYQLSMYLVHPILNPLVKPCHAGCPLICSSRISSRT